MSCNSAMTMAMQGAYDPIFALGLRIANPNISQADEYDPNRFNADLAARAKAMLERVRGAEPVRRPAHGAGIVTRDTEVWVNYDIILEVAPFATVPSATGGKGP